MAKEFQISATECSERYTKYLETHIERPKSQEIDFALVTEILSDFGVYVTREPPVTSKVRSVYTACLFIFKLL